VQKNGRKKVVFWHTRQLPGNTIASALRKEFGRKDGTFWDLCLPLSKEHCTKNRKCIDITSSEPFCAVYEFILMPGATALEREVEVRLLQPGRAERGLSGAFIVCEGATMMRSLGMAILDSAHIL
jgi:hypothetical protein